MMFIPKIQVEPLKPFFNKRLICRYLSPEKAANKTLPFAEKTYAMYPELRGVLEGKTEEERKSIIEHAVEDRLNGAAEEIRARVAYFQAKFDVFLPDFIAAQCELYRYTWKAEHPVINCWVGYIPFYPRSAAAHWFYVSYQDEERVFAGAVHEINHMIFYEKWKEMQGGGEMPEPGHPSPLWYLQEMIVDPTLNDPAVKPHTLYDNRAYEQFYTTMIEGKSVMTHLRAMYDAKTDIEDFMRRGLEFVEQNYAVIHG